MFSKKLYLKIIAEKPDIFGNIPDSILPEEKIEELRQMPRLAIGEISGVKGLAGLLYSLSKKRPDAFLPTVSYTGTEYGDWKYIEDILKYINKIIEKNLRIYVAEPLILGSPHFWWALNGRFANELRDRFGFYSQCYGCRLYSFALRVPLSKRLNADVLIPADMETRNGDFKIYNSSLAVNYYSTLMSSFGIYLWYTHLSGIQKKEMAEEFNLQEQQENSKILNCIFKDNYKNLEGSFKHPSNISSFFETFAIPAAAKIISRTLSGATVDYVREVADTLLPVAKPKKKRKQLFSHKGTKTQR